MFPLTLGGIDDDIIALLAVGGGFVVAVVAIVSSAIRSILVNKQREQSRREIAAYVAEGSMTPDDGAKLIAAGRSPLMGCDRV